MTWASTEAETKRYHLTYEQLRLAKEKYNAQRKAAAKRRIEWHFTFPTWIEWWIKELGWDWQSKRGKHRGLCCMSRRGDKGPYAIWNVECKPTEENCTDRKVNGSAARQNNNGKNNPNAKLTEAQVVEIYYAAGSLNQIGKRYGVCFSCVWGIKKRHTWKYVTEGL